MSKKIHYEGNPFGKVELGKTIKLAGIPSPAELAQAERTTKVTLSLSSQAVAFFKAKAEELHVPYQVMIRRLLDDYASRF